MTAIADELLDALESVRGRTLLRGTQLDILKDPVALEALTNAVLAALDRRAVDEVGGLKALAGWIGCKTGDAARKRVERDPELAALAFKVGKQNRFRKSEVIGLLARRRGGGK